MPGQQPTSSSAMILWMRYLSSKHFSITRFLIHPWTDINHQSIITYRGLIHHHWPEWQAVHRQEWASGQALLVLSSWTIFNSTIVYDYMTWIATDQFHIRWVTWRFVVAVGGHPISHVFSLIWLCLHLGSFPVNNVPGYKLSFSQLWKQDTLVGAWRGRRRVLTEVELKLLAIAGVRVSLIVLASFTLT